MRSTNALALLPICIRTIPKASFDTELCTESQNDTPTLATHHQIREQGATAHTSEPEHYFDCQNRCMDEIAEANDELVLQTEGKLMHSWPALSLSIGSILVRELDGGIEGKNFAHLAGWRSAAKRWDDFERDRATSLSLQH